MAEVSGIITFHLNRTVRYLNDIPKMDNKDNLKINNKK